MRQAMCYALVVSSAALTSSADAQCGAIDFEDFATGTVITSQYDGVTFSAPPGSCPGGVDLRIVSPTGGSSSGFRALGVDLGCPDFSDDYIRMVFDVIQDHVTFTLGERTGFTGPAFEVRAYSTSSGGSPHTTLSVTPGLGIRTFVSIGSDGGTANIKRVEVEGGFSTAEGVDDLNFDLDTTPPEAEITSPGFGACVCSIVSVQGTSCDDDGDYGFDMLEFRSVGDDEGPWTLIGSFATPLCAEGTLYTWDTATVPGGTYYLRLTAENACGLHDTDITVVTVDKAFGTINITNPDPAEEVCGVVDIGGTVNDGCLDSFTVDYSPAGAGAWVPVDPTTPIYTAAAINCLAFARWDTVVAGIDKGDYEIRVRGTDICGHTDEVIVPVHVDNTEPCGNCSADLNGDGVVGPSDLAILLGSWGPLF